MSNTVFDRATQFGGDDGFKIKMGGQIRYSFAVLATGATAFRRGRVLDLAADGTVDVATAPTNGALKGLAIERRDPVGGRPADDETVGSKLGSLLLDEAIVTTGEVTSGTVIAINDPLYHDSAGRITSAVSGQVLGKALSDAVGDGGAGERFLTMLWSGQLV